MYNQRNHDWTCEMTREEMGAFLVCGLRTVSYVLKEMTELGWIKRNQGKGARRGAVNKLMLR